jgi:hypothetical protein
MRNLHPFALLDSQSQVCWTNVQNTICSFKSAYVHMMMCFRKDIWHIWHIWRWLHLKMSQHVSSTSSADCYILQGCEERTVARNWCGHQLLRLATVQRRATWPNRAHRFWIYMFEHVWTTGTSSEFPNSSISVNSDVYYESERLRKDPKGPRECKSLIYSIYFLKETYKTCRFRKEGLETWRRLCWSLHIHLFKIPAEFGRCEILVFPYKQTMVIAVLVPLHSRQVHCSQTLSH